MEMTFVGMYGETFLRLTVQNLSGEVLLTACPV